VRKLCPYVRERKRELGWSTRATCVPQSYAGQEGQVDWYEAWAELGGAPVLLQVFSIRSMVAARPFIERIIAPTSRRKAAVKKILRGFRRAETAQFIAFRSHWQFQSDFCTPAEPHEKGGIEGEAGYFRRNHWVPIPKARDLAELNVQLLAALREDERRQIAGHAQTGGCVDDRRACAAIAARRAGFRAGGARVSARGRARLRAGADQSLCGAGPARQDARGATLSQLCRSAG
jgi:hypothetical protein